MSREEEITKAAEKFAFSHKTETPNIYDAINDFYYGAKWADENQPMRKDYEFLFMLKKKELIKKFKVVIEDLLDNYEEYTDDEKAQIKEIFQKVADLNTILDKYDIDVRFDWDEYLAACSQYFDPTRYL